LLNTTHDITSTTSDIIISYCYEALLQESYVQAGSRRFAVVKSTDQTV